MPQTRQRIETFVNHEYSNSQKDINEAVTDFTSIVQSAAKVSTRFVKIKPRKKLSKPWFDANCFEARQNFDFIKKLYDKFPHKRDIRESYYRHVRYYRKLKNNKKSAFKDEILKSLNDNNTCSKNQFWNTFNKLDFNKSADIDPIDPNTWYNYYKNLNKCTVDTSVQNHTELNNLESSVPNSNILDSEISISEIKQCISKLKLKKSGGTDLINNEMIKLGKDILVGPLQKLYNMVLESGIYPSDWKTGIIVNLFKSGKCTDPSNYRGISLTSVLGKLLSAIINKRVVKFLDENKLLSDFQAGFRSDYRTTDHMFVLHKTIKFYQNRGKKLYVAFVDFHKAFDKLWRHGLLIKLLKRGIGGNLYRLIKTMYNGNTSQVRVGNKCTPSFPCESGVRQGDTLSPTLFNIFVDDITKLMNSKECFPAKVGTVNIGCLFYADDLVIISESKEGLQHSLNSLSQYCNDWYLKVNNTKTKVMVFEKLRNKTVIDMYLNGYSLEQVNSYKYLGITFTDNGSLVEAQNVLLKKALKVYYCMSNMLYSAKRTNITSYTTAFDALVKPIVTYGCELWGLETLESKIPEKILSGQKILLPAEKLEMKFLKYLLGVHKGACNIAVRSELGKYPLRFYILSQILKYYYRVKLGCKNMMLNNLFNELCDISVNPFSKLLTLLVDCKLTIDAPLNRKQINTKIKKSLKSLDHVILDKWDNEIDNNRKLITYNDIKESHDPEYYVKYVDDRYLRKYLTMLRLSCHPLAIETGRYKKIPQNLRICQNCNMNEIENEFHFVMKCTLYQQIRNGLFKFLNESNSENWLKANTLYDKFKIIMQPYDQKSAITVCQFIKSCFDIRKQKEYT